VDAVAFGCVTVGVAAYDGRCNLLAAAATASVFAPIATATACCQFSAPTF